MVVLMLFGIFLLVIPVTGYFLAVLGNRWRNRTDPDSEL
jgi:hypothetical protein